MCPAAFASGIRSFAGRSTSPHRAAGGWCARAVRRGARSPRCRPGGARAPRRARRKTGRRGRVATLREAGTQPPSAPASAAHWFAVALRLLADDAPVDERVELLLARAGALATCGHFTEAHSALLETIELVPEEAVALRVRLTTACAGVEHLLGLHEDAYGRLARALEGLEDAGPRRPPRS